MTKEETAQLNRIQTAVDKLQDEVSGEGGLRVQMTELRKDLEHGFKSINDRLDKKTPVPPPVRTNFNYAGWGTFLGAAVAAAAAGGGTLWSMVGAATAEQPPAIEAKP